MQTDIFSKLRLLYETLSPVERRLADAVLGDPQSFIDSSMTELAGRTGVSQGSINNFSKKLCGDGFAKLKLQLAAQLSLYSQPSFTAVKDSDSVRDVLSEQIEQSAAAFENTLRLNSEESLEKAADMIMNAGKIELYGLFQAGIMANNFSYQLLQLGLPAVFVSDVLLAPVSASMLDKSGLVIAVSTSGKTKDILDAVRIAKSAGASVMTITSNPTSPLAKAADNVLIAASSGRTISGNMSDILLSQTLLANTLCQYLRARIDKDGKERYFRLKDIIASHSVKDQ